MATSSTVRQTVTTTVQQSPSLDNNLDALLEDLQTSVSRPPSSAAMNGTITPSGTRAYREVTTRTVQHESTPGYQVQYLSAANPTTVVSERASSPGVELLQQQQPGGGSVTAYKTVQYQYKTSSSSSANTQPISGLLVDGSSVTTAPDPTSDARLQQNLNELDSLLVDLHQAQKTGFGPDQGGVPSGVVNTRTVDTSLLEPVEHSTPSRQQQVQQMTRVVQQRTYVDGGGSSHSPVRYQTEPQSSPRLQPKRSSSAQRELMYGTVDTQHRTRSPSPLRHPDPSPRVPHRTVVQKEAYYETKSNTTPKPERYRDKSPSNRRLQKEMYYESPKSSTPVPPSPQHDRYRDASPPSSRRAASPMRPDTYPTQPAGSSSKVTTVRTYNYNTAGGPAPSPVPPVSRSGAPSPSPVSRSPYPDNTTQVIELSPSPVPYGAPTHLPGSPPPGTKVTTTVRTYTYELPGQPGTIQPVNPNYNPADRTLTYQVSPREKEPLLESPPPQQPPTIINYKIESTPHQPQPPTVINYKIESTPHQPQPPTVINYKIESQPQQQPPTIVNYKIESQPPQQPTPPAVINYKIETPPPQPPPTVITYKYSSHSSHSTSSKYPHPPEEQQPLLPRPFPTPSPTPGSNADSQPPKRLDELMASFSDTETTNHYIPEKPAPHPPPYSEGSNGVAVVTPTPNAKAAATAKAAASANAAAKDRQKSKNVTGPPVYYPPGVELFARKEESMMQMQGKKGSERYEYEYAKESKSKSSSSGGAAVVPVCLPLCCAMPCVIM